MAKNDVFRKDLFDKMIQSITVTANENDLHGANHKALGIWFSELYFPNFKNCHVSDGRGDGKIDCITYFQKGKKIFHAVINSKYTETYDKLAPPAFYSEAVDFHNFFANKNNRSNAIGRVRQALRRHYEPLLEDYDENELELIFLTTCKKNDKYHDSCINRNLKFIHLDDLLMYFSEFMEGQKPVRIEPLLLSGISTVLSADPTESKVPTSIVFARIYDFVQYMRNDPQELLFARNVRLYLDGTETNNSILSTYETEPDEFVYSNNGITLLCNRFSHDPGHQELQISNPRVVNGSQTLHSIFKARKHDSTARVMVKIIQIPTAANDIRFDIQKRKDIILKISLRTNSQNPIKRWDLVSNDDFQNSIFEYFFKRKIYYERRRNEWKTRREHFKEIKISYGIDTKQMMQLLSCYHFKSKDHGPAVAQGNLGSLFNEESYYKLSATKPLIAYQLYLLYGIQDAYLKSLYRRKRNPLPKYYKYILFTLFLKDLKAQGVLGKDSLSQSIDDGVFEEIDFKKYNDTLIEYIEKTFVGLSKKYKKETGVDLSLSNFAKNNNMVSAVIDGYELKRNANVLKRLKR
jgi:hypothetical protein